MNSSILSKLTLLAGSIIASCSTYGSTESLPAMGADIQQTSLSGFSSGAFMSVQFHVSHSDIVKGVGIFAGGPWNCARGSFHDAAVRCMRPKKPQDIPDIKPLLQHTHEVFRAGKIADLQNLKNSRIFLFSGLHDTIVFQPVMNKLEEYYNAFTKPENILYKKDLGAGHGMISDSHGKPCDYNGSPFLNNCGYDGAGEVLKHIYGPLNQPSQKPQGRIIRYDQTEFIDGKNAAELGLDKTGYAYIPKACEKEQCRIHVFFHGCLQNASTVSTELVENAGFNRWADTNNLIVLYPQTIKPKTISLDPGKINPMGCWDWWGYSGEDYYTREAPQIKVVRAMLDRLAKERK